MNQKLLRLTKLASKSEKTPELQQYWKKQYSEVLKDEVFIINLHTTDLFEDKDIINKPATPLGEILLLGHTDKNNKINEEALQQTITVAVRFLDSLIDQINFSEEARKITEEYRKIGLGIGDIKEYFVTQENKTEIEKID